MAKVTLVINWQEVAVLEHALKASSTELYDLMLKSVQYNDEESFMSQVLAFAEVERLIERLDMACESEGFMDYAERKAKQIV